VFKTLYRNQRDRYITLNFDKVALVGADTIGMPSISDERTRLEFFDQPSSLNETLAREHDKLERIAKNVVEKKIQRIYLVGMGSSYSAALTAKVFAASITTIPVDVFRGYEFEFEEPLGLGKDSLVVPISFSGETEDVVSALRYAKKSGAYVVSVSGPEDNTLAKEADDALRIVSKDTKAMVAAHRTQILLLYLLLGHVAKLRDGATRVEEIVKEIDGVIRNLGKIITEQESKMNELAEMYKNDEVFYVISAGPNYGVAYKLAMTELTENAWVHGIVQYSTEFRHGIVEKIEANLPVIFLVGTDSSRVDVLRELETCRKLNARTIVWDANEFPNTDPFLTPFYLAVPAEWFVYHLALKRGRLPSERRYMGSVIPYANMKSLSSR